MWKVLIITAATYIGVPIFIGYRMERRKEYPRDH
jgi:hypothetical protein